MLFIMLGGDEDGGMLGFEIRAAVELREGLSGENKGPWGKRFIGGPMGDWRVDREVEGGRRDGPGCVSNRKAFGGRGGRIHCIELVGYAGEAVGWDVIGL